MKSKSPRHTLKITIASLPWKVKFLDKKQIHRVVKDTVMGYCDPTERVIYVCYEYDKISILSTFWHEFFHAVVSPASNADEGAKDMVEEETAANSLGNAMVEIWPYVPSIYAKIDEIVGPEVEDEED